MDTTKTINLMEWCAGYCGIGLGLKSVLGERLRTIAYCELEGFAQANIISKMEKGLLDVAPLWSDLKTFPCQEFHGLVDILVAGYPCQPFSAAGKRQGENDPRHLWPYIRNAIGTMEPGMCFLENVEGHISLGLSTVISDLEELGYKVSWGIFSASEVGAPHQRKRVFIMAHRHGERGQLPDWWRVAAEQVPVGYGQAWRNDQWPSRPGEQQHAWEPPRVVADSKKSGRLSERVTGNLDGSEGSQGGGGDQSTSTSPDCGDAGAEETTLANDHRPHAGHGEQRPERTLGDLSGGCGEAMGNSLLHGHAAGEITGGISQSQRERRVQKPSGGSGAMGDTEHARSRNEKSAQDCWEQNTDGRGNPHEGVRASRTSESMGNADHGRLASGIHAGSSPEADRRGQGDIEQAESGKIESNVGLHIDESSFGVGNTKLSGLCDSELAEIHEWMVKCDNRTDELRLLGNGVVVATAEKAFTTLLGMVVLPSENNNS